MDEKQGMANVNPNKKSILNGLPKTVRAILAIAVLAIVAVYGLALTVYSPTLNPILAWHGANIAVIGLFSDKKESNYQFNPDLIENAKALESHKYKKIELIETQNKKSEIGETINENKILVEKVRNELQGLQGVGDQLAHSQKMIEDLNLEVDSLNAGTLQDQQNREQLQQTTLDVADVPTEQDLQGLKSSGASNAAKSQIPEAVLSNVEATTGISSEEINALMNQ